MSDRFPRLIARSGLVIGAVLGMAGTFVLSSMEGPIEQSLEQGMTVLDSRRGSFAAAYRKGDRVIYMEANRGAARPPPYQQDPGGTKYEVDARFLGEDGSTFYLRRGGDRFVDPAWGKAYGQQNENRPPGHEDWFQMAAEAAELIEAELPGRLGPAA
jgi:hypothetical protein